MLLKPLPLLALALSGCCHDFLGSWDGTATLEECAGMVPVIEWSSEDAGTSWVEFGLDEDYGMVTPTSDEPSTSHSHHLLGMPPLSEVFFRAYTEVDGKQRWASGSVVTEGVPPELPDFRITVPLPEDYDSDPYILGTAFGGQPVVFAMDRRGNWLWYRMVDGDKNPIELAFDPSTGDVLFNSFLTDHGEDDSNVTRASFDCEEDEDIDTPLGHHAFTVLPDGSIAYIAIEVQDYDIGDAEGSVPWVGDAIQIVGEDEPIWSTWEWREPEKVDGWDGTFYPQGHDWTHANALHYSQERDSYLLSLRNYDMILEVAGDGSQVLHEYGGDFGYAFDEGSRAFNYQHDPDWTADGTLLMISTDVDTDETTAVEYEVDHDAQLLREVWSHGDGEGFSVLIQGTARDLPNGNRLVNLGSEGVIREVTYEGEVVWEMSALAGSAVGNTIPFPDMYDPLGE